MYSSIIHYRGWLCPLQFHWNPNFLSILYLYFSFWAPGLSLIFLSRDSQLALKRLLMHLFADNQIGNDNTPEIRSEDTDCLLDVTVVSRGADTQRQVRILIGRAVCVKVSGVEDFVPQPDAALIMSEFKKATRLSV